MRIISQDGMKDFPYEKTSFEVRNKSDKAIKKAFIKAFMFGDEFGIIMAEYSTPERAVKELENMRNEYEMAEMYKYDEQYRLSTNYRRFCFQFPQE